jgi:hypothetical protein
VSSLPNCFQQHGTERTSRGGMPRAKLGEHRSDQARLPPQSCAVARPIPWTSGQHLHAGHCRTNPCSSGSSSISKPVDACLMGQACVRLLCFSRQCPTSIADVHQSLMYSIMTKGKLSHLSIAALMSHISIFYGERQNRGESSIQASACQYQQNVLPGLTTTRTSTTEFLPIK